MAWVRRSACTRRVGRNTTPVKPTFRHPKPHKLVCRRLSNAQCRVIPYLVLLKVNWLEQLAVNSLAAIHSFRATFAPAAQAATAQFNKAIGDVTSAASRAGRYGSGAMERLQGQASNQLATAAC